MRFKPASTPPSVTKVLKLLKQLETLETPETLLAAGKS